MRYLSQKEGKETLEVNLERNGLTTGDCKDRESVTQGEGIITPSRPSYSTGSTLRKNRIRLLRETAQRMHTHWNKQAEEDGGR